MPEFILPPLRHRQIARKGGWESRLDTILLRAVAAPSWKQILWRWAVYVVAFYVLLIAPLIGEQRGMLEWAAFAFGFCVAIILLKSGFKRNLAVLTLRFGRTFPYISRPWYGLSWLMRSQLAKVRFETARTQFLRRLFSLEWTDGVFRPAYAITNWITFLVGLYVFPLLLSFSIEALYAYSTYPFGTHHDVIVTEAYRNITDQSTFAVHGYQLINGEKKELYFEIGPNIWFWNLYPEFLFGQLPLLGRCTFDTYGITLRIPRRLRLFTAGSLYALNPWIVDMHCVPPTVVPPQK